MKRKSDLWIQLSGMGGDLINASDTLLVILTDAFEVQDVARGIEYRFARRKAEDTAHQFIDALEQMFEEKTAMAIQKAVNAERERWTKYEVALTDCVEALNDFNPTEDRYWNATRKAEAMIEGRSIAAKPLMEDE